MSYSLVSAIGKAVGGAGRWATVDIGNMSFSDIYANYLQVIATLSNPFDPANTALNLSDIQFEIPDPSVTFNQYLINIGNASLPTSSTLPVLKTVYAKYNDAFLAGYTVTPVSPNAALDSPLPVSEKTDLALTQTGVDFTLFGKSCMVSVNGYFHYLDTDVNGAYVRDGMTSNTLSNDNQIGVYSLAPLGSITYVDLTPDMIYTPSDGQLLQNGVYINVGQDITEKTILLVIGGYLSVLDDSTFTRVGDDLIKIDWNNFPYFNRYFESVGTIDMSSLGLEHTDRNASQVAVADLLSDAAIRAYCSLSQSFIVLLDNTEVFVDRQFVRDHPFPGMYISYVKPEFPLITGHGKVSEWWPSFETGQWGINVRDGRIDRRVFYTTNPKKLNSVADNRIPARPYRISPAEYLMIGTDVSSL